MSQEQNKNSQEGMVVKDPIQQLEDQLQATERAEKLAKSIGDQERVNQVIENRSKVLRDLRNTLMSQINDAEDKIDAEVKKNPASLPEYAQEKEKIKSLEQRLDQVIDTLKGGAPKEDEGQLLDEALRRNGTN